MANPRVKRVVLTSSGAAISGGGDIATHTEEDKNTTSNLSFGAYAYSKTMAERAAWDFVAAKSPGFKLVVVNPYLVIGPCHGPALNQSHITLTEILKGRLPGVMALHFIMVDVRDVAATHIAAMRIAGATGRHICAAETVSMRQIVGVMADLGYRKLPKLSLDNWVENLIGWLASYAQPKEIGRYLRGSLGNNSQADDRKSREKLGITYRPASESIRDAVADLAKWGHVGPPG